MRLPEHGKYMIHLTEIPDLGGSRIQMLENVALRLKFSILLVPCPYTVNIRQLIFFAKIKRLL